MINGYVITLDTSQESIEASHKCIGSIRSTESEITPHVFVRQQFLVKSRDILKRLIWEVLYGLIP